MSTHRVNHNGGDAPLDISSDEKNISYTSAVDDTHDRTTQGALGDEKHDTTTHDSFADEKSVGVPVVTTHGLDPLATMSMAMPERTMGMTNADEIAKVPFVSEDWESLKGDQSAAEKADRMSEIALHVLKLDDDPTLNVWTFRVFFIGIGLAVFSSTLATIYMFKPQGITLSATFLAVISFVLGTGLEKFVPKSGFIGKWFNHQDFNTKEHAAIIIMATSAAHAAMASELIAVQRLWYGSSPSPGVCIFLIFASQTLGYGIAGLMRTTLTYPTKMVYPNTLPLNVLLDTLHKDRRQTLESNDTVTPPGKLQLLVWKLLRKDPVASAASNRGSKVSSRLKLFYWSFGLIFVWEVMPEYIMPILTGVSVFCLAKRDSLVFTNLFGGANGNEGLGFLSLCFDFQYIGSTALYLPLQTIVNTLVGYLGGIAMFMGLYYSNVWRAKDLPFLSQLLFTTASNSTHPVRFNQTAVLDASGTVDLDLLALQGVPLLTPTYASYVLVQNLAIAATFTHMFLFHWHDLKSAWSFISMENLKAFVQPWKWNFKFWQNKTVADSDSGSEQDPHYRMMLAYKDAPQWWYALTLIIACVVGLVCIYKADSGLPWWAFFVAIAVAAICILFFGSQYAMTGFHVPVQPLVQMLGAYINPGKPLTSMYFTLFGYNTVVQGYYMLSDLKLGQYAKVPPRATFTCQMIGTIVGAIMNYVMMLSITTNQREILLSIEGTNIWSGAQIQSFNTQAVSWGGLAKQMYSVGTGRYQWVPLAFLIGFIAPLPFYFAHRLWPKLGFNYWNVAIIVWHLGYLCTGINSSLTSFFLLAFWSQLYLRKYKPAWFLKYNYVLCAGLDGGTQVIVFILSFAVFGSSGKSVPFPGYWGNKPTGNIDYCMRAPK